MYYPIRYIQDIADLAGLNSPVAPFAKSTPKDRYAILYYDHDLYSKKTRLLFEDYIAYHGEKLDRRDFVYADGKTSSAQFLYGKEGNLWKIDWKYSQPVPRKWNEDKIGKKYQKVEDVYVDGYLRERNYVGEKHKETFYFGQDRHLRNTIYCECVYEGDDDLYRYVEKYDGNNRIISQQIFSSKISNPAEVFFNDLFVYHYNGDAISQIDRIIDGGQCIGREVFSNIDARGNWLKSIKSLKFDDEDAEKPGMETNREIAYDEASAIELRAKFESLKTEIIVDNEA